ncbi:MAG: DUF1559 domain-containing protein [Thermoguttaceae bacterium]|nr:DUF1559 domain-containing protein [Thermoguttaceae bacterium]
MQIRLGTLFLIFVYVASSVGAFGVAGIALALYLMLLLIAIRLLRSGASLGCLLLALFFLLAISLVLPAFSCAREAARRAQCANNLKQIALALHNYHDMHGCLPPAVVRDAQGKPMHSWRVLILPYLEAMDLYKQYDFNEPWDGPKNRLLAPKMPSVYRCPSAARRDEHYITPYVVVTGSGTYWPESGSSRLGDGTDDTSKTLLVVEWADSDICWMEPRDPSLAVLAGAESLPREIPSGHGYRIGYFVVEEGGGGQVAMADGSVRFLGGPLSVRGLAALAAHSDGDPRGDRLPETYLDPTRLRRWIDWGHVIGFSVFGLTFLVLLWKAAFAPLEKRPAPPTQPTGPPEPASGA